MPRPVRHFPRRDSIIHWLYVAFLAVYLGSGAAAVIIGALTVILLLVILGLFDDMDPDDEQPMP